MQTCVFPLELCEAIIGAVPSTIESLPVPYTQGKNWTSAYDVLIHERNTLCACSLTCRAWRTRSQTLLWKRPLLLLPDHISSFYRIVREDATYERVCLVSEMCMTCHKYMPCIAFAGDIVVHTFPNLRVLHINDMDWSPFVTDGIPRPMLRAHLPLFANLIRLECHGCVFPDERYFFEIIWACCNLVHLKGCHTYESKGMPARSSAPCCYMRLLFSYLITHSSALHSVLLLRSSKPARNFIRSTPCHGQHTLPFYGYAHCYAYASWISC
ncbi:hypothetical protein PYCCODRAFT_322268 [Trametes coccinea BRFM310]|uniref:F-box domain-containing protein n=1 Tax=Trametes coccinea (strain BRFM310) TaxID=1353009 RepID=A0A1Y2IN93_TRAC3|nr:hypothetical protein PYCCODRAFT_322268 [Trametes coccinea BRFM310]